MNRPSLYSIDIWTHWENGILSFLIEALGELSKVAIPTDDENTITDSLHKTVLTIKFKRDKITFGSIVRQTQNQPIYAVGVSENETSLRKKPDLLWVFNDENATTPEKSQRYFTIECKCLSTEEKDKDYVEKGVSRFILNDWGYGRNEKSGAMIGYIKQYDAGKHYICINKHNSINNYPTIIESSKLNAISKYIQSIEIREFEPKEFTLYHLWTCI